MTPSNYLKTYNFSMIITASMKKLLKIVTLVVILISILVGLFALAVNSYIKPIPTTVPIAEYTKSQNDLQTQKAIDNLLKLSYDAKIKSLTKQDSDVCAYAKANKLVIPASLCQ